MPADRLHLVRHGEVHNPRRVLYGRLPGFGLSADGHRMARQAAEYVHGLERPIAALICSPLQRTQESARPFTELFGIDAVIDERVIEPTNVFEGKRMVRALVNPWSWRHLRKPALPSWGEPYADVVGRMNAAMTRPDASRPAHQRGSSTRPGSAMTLSATLAMTDRSTGSSAMSPANHVLASAGSSVH